MTSQASARRSLLARSLATEASPALLVARVLFAAVMFPHGAQKLLGWYGGYGFEGTLGFFTETIGLPTPLAAGIIALEFFGPILLVLGLGTRAVALGFAGIMAGAVATVHGEHGFFMNWSGAQAGEGYEYHLLAIALAVVLVARGAGALSLDRRFANHSG